MLDLFDFVKGSTLAFQKTSLTKTGKKRPKNTKYERQQKKKETPKKPHEQNKRDAQYPGSNHSQKYSYRTVLLHKIVLENISHGTMPIHSRNL